MEILDTANDVRIAKQVIEGRGQPDIEDQRAALSIINRSYKG